MGIVGFALLLAKKARTSVSKHINKDKELPVTLYKVAGKDLGKVISKTPALFKSREAKTKPVPVMTPLIPPPETRTRVSPCSTALKRAAAKC